jgi:hypothetical protein
MKVFCAEFTVAVFFFLQVETCGAITRLNYYRTIKHDQIKPWVVPADDTLNELLQEARNSKNSRTRDCDGSTKMTQIAAVDVRMAKIQESK